MLLVLAVPLSRLSRIDMALSLGRLGCSVFCDSAIQIDRARSWMLGVLAVAWLSWVALSWAICGPTVSVYMRSITPGDCMEAQGCRASISDTDCLDGVFSAEF